MNKEQTQDILETMREVRDILLPKFGNIGYSEKSNPRDLVTRYDIEVESFLKRNLEAIYPAAGFCGEETGGDRSQNLFWLVDPIDGTGHFIRGIANCSTMVSLVENETVVFSAIYDFVNNDMYHAVKGEGSFKNGMRINVSKRKQKEAILGWEIQKRDTSHEKVLGYLVANFGYYNTLCAGMPFALVAEGKIEGLVFYSPFGNDYDFAAGSLLVSEAGGFVKNLGEQTYSFDNSNFIATSQVVGPAPKETLEKIISSNT